ncbi:UDP-glucuronic acid decarboxylase family protein [Candidatus Riflebacteria bacterium]
MKTCLVTGGAGFIGSHLCDALLEKGHRVICLDNLFTGRKENVQHLFDHRDFEFVRHDITQPYMAEVDWIFNLACPASPVHYQRNPIKTIKTSFLGTLNTLGLAKRVNARYLLSSTSEVYGDPLLHPQKESYFGNVNPIGLRACYDEGKRIAETLCFEYLRKNNVQPRIARIFNTYGPRMSCGDGRVVSNFIDQALRNQDLTVFGDGRQTRSFCYVTDLIDGLVKLMQHESLVGPVNLGNPEEINIIDFANLIIKLSGSSSKIVFKEKPEDDPAKRCPDISLAKEKLNFQPDITLEDGLTRSIEYFKAELAKA